MQRLFSQQNSRLLTVTKRFGRLASTYTEAEKQKYLNEPPYVLPNHKKIISPSIVYISGEEMTRYTMSLILDKWIAPHLDTSKWEYFDLSCKNRDATNDKVLLDSVIAGKRLCAIFKEPTITPSAAQVKEFGLSKPYPSPNGAMRKGWNGITISRDTIHIDGIKLGYDKQVLFDRHAVGGEYGAQFKAVGKGRLVTTFFPDDGSSPILAGDRTLTDNENVVVTYHNPLDNVKDLAHHFFARCLEKKFVPYVVTKKTVFKWQESFWLIMKNVFDEHYKQKYIDAGVLPDGKLSHLISDSATMQIVKWRKGGFGMAAHNYDGDMLTDEISTVHRSPGFITSSLIGKREDGVLIRENEASHGTVSDLWAAHNRGEETSMNPLGLTEALIATLNHAAEIENKNVKSIRLFTDTLRKALHNTFRYGQGTKDMAGEKGLSTEKFIEKVAWRLGRYLAKMEEDESILPEMLVPSLKFRRNYNVDRAALEEMFNEFDTDRSGTINIDEFETLMVKLGVAPLKDPNKKSSASSDKSRETQE